MKNRKQNLDLLIYSQEGMQERNCLTDTGIAYLNGLKMARKILFPEDKRKIKKIK